MIYDLDNMRKDNYLTNWFKKNISNDIVEVLVDREDIKIEKKHLNLDFSAIVLVYPDRNIGMCSSEWFSMSKLD